MKDKIIYFISALLIIAAVVLVMRNINGCSGGGSITDTLRITDTVKEETIIYLKAKPVTIIKYDTAITRELLNRDLIESIEQGGGEYRIKTFNPSDSTGKEFRIKDFDRVQTIGDGLLYKQSSFKWSGFSFETEFANKFSTGERTIRTKAGTGIIYKDIIEVSGFAGYDFTWKEFQAGVNLRINILKKQNLKVNK